MFAISGAKLTLNLILCKKRFVQNAKRCTKTVVCATF